MSTDCKWRRAVESTKELDLSEIANNIMKLLKVSIKFMFYDIIMVYGNGYKIYCNFKVIMLY